MEILRLSGRQISRAREELISEGIISYRRPYWQVKNISQGRSNARARDDKANDTVSSGRAETELLSDTGPDRDSAKAGLTHISRILSGG